MNDELREVRRTRPAPVEGWADSAEGRELFDTVLTHTRAEPVPRTSRRHRRRALTIGAALLLAVGAGGGVAVATGVPFSPGDTSGGMCARTLSAQADLSPPKGAFDPGDPAKACADSWHQMWGDGTPKPARFVACRHPGKDAGGSVVYPAGRFADATSACASIGAEPIPAANR
ncbi:hypothetical protein ACWT_5472 [Actinoplanes sp. SE50]|uniref:hypothetical protein n=1 Tax=unclassified Actinoplanes TaxID=2626549 RepID=UPI00023EC851|nr:MULTISPECIES: hypothetical protein [unclassified Actinoplanes]AEV86489.1 hypothetical protein ACPL_5602 [Actinoplanes sp. SE50/110]ATO84887.1 hypothetical protein ACWT_5472 [Actinoplanes sp. SE50]SLM02296.1 hypothetical protein ACSP50_5535 [Actinoplanes sp. SE50/110]